MVVRSLRSMAGRAAVISVVELVDSSLRTLVASAFAFIANGQVGIMSAGTASTARDVAFAGSTAPVTDLESA